MGIHPKLDLQRSSSFSVIPPGMASPVSVVSLSHASEGKYFGRTAPISPPMSSHEPRKISEMSTGRGLSLAQGPRELRSEAPRQQLPSLSSLFGASQHVRPLHSPQSDRPSPIYGAQSPSERPSSASTKPERPYSSSSSYFPSIAPTLNQPRPVYEPRLATERPTLPSVARTFPGPLSPPIREHDQAHQAARNDSNAGGKWAHSNGPETRRSEYVYSARPTTPAFRPPGEQHRVPLPSLAQNFGYEANQPPKMDVHHQPGRSSSSPSSPSYASLEGMTVKDGLGPKIWTGTHFLPRFVRRAEVPGEGLCYFYDDGTHCKTVIDGEPVNAHWGVTKAGKPRKRLAIACLTCREKKIKCDPDYPRCVQCEKFGRICKFKNAPRGGHNTSPVTSPGELIELERPRSVSSSSMSPNSAKHSHPSPELPSLSAKRPRFAYQPYPPPPPPTSCPYPMMPMSEMKPTSAPWQPRELPRIRDDVMYQKWEAGPYFRDPQRMR